MVAQGILYTLVTFIGFTIGHFGADNLDKTMAFAVLAFSHIFGSFALSTRLPIWDFRRYKANLWLVLSMLVTSVVVVFILCVEPLQTVFNTVDLGGHWLTVILLSIIPAFVVEVAKIVYSIVGSKR